LSGTITLLGGALPLTRTLSIAGPGANVLVVDGNNAARIFEVQAGSTIALSGLTLQRGDAGVQNGGAIRVTNASLTLTDTAILSSTAALGGAIYADSQANVSLNRSTFAANSANSGAGLYGDTLASFSVANSTLSGNTATSLGGGIALGNAAARFAIPAGW
jgi:hypothetical protein